MSFNSPRFAFVMGVRSAEMMTTSSPDGGDLAGAETLTEVTDDSTEGPGAAKWDARDRSLSMRWVALLALLCAPALGQRHECHSSEFLGGYMNLSIKARASGKSLLLRPHAPDRPLCRRSGVHARQQNRRNLKIVRQ